MEFFQFFENLANSKILNFSDKKKFFEKKIKIFSKKKLFFPIFKSAPNLEIVCKFKRID